MRLSEAKAPVKPLTVDFDGGAQLQITYRVPEYTPNQASELMNGAGRDPKQAAELVTRTIETWDLQREDGEPIPLTADAVAAEVPLHILNKIVIAINADQKPSGEAGDNSADG